MAKLTGAELDRRITKLIQYCEDTGEPPVAHVVSGRVKLTEEELADLRRGEGGEALRQAAERLEEYREYFWIKKGLKDSKWATFATFNLKELKGADEEGGEVRVTVRMEGVGEDAFG